MSAVLLAVILACSPALAQQTRTVDGMVVNFGVMPAEVAVHAEGHAEAHPAHPPAGAQHLLITLDDAKSHERIGDANVTIELKDPRGKLEKKPLLHTHGGGLPDYSELYVFSWSGDYDVRVVIVRQPGAKPVETHFTVHHRV
ncbi:MAG TPA: hypothetical protein VFC24_07395 [Casimicrobiaceae bacterium]|nr:hypothetical protein [Casimicrobiaceae bacterium]